MLCNLAYYVAIREKKDNFFIFILIILLIQSILESFICLLTTSMLWENQKLVFFQFANIERLVNFDWNSFFSFLFLIANITY